MKEKLTALLLALAMLLSLSACGNSNAQGKTDSADCGQLTRTLLGAQELPSGLHLLELGVTEDFENWFQLRYGFWNDQIETADVTVVDGVSGFEVAVVAFASDGVAEECLPAMLEYQEQRAAAFTGYAPEAEQMVDDGLVDTYGNYLVLAFCSDPDAIDDMMKGYAATGEYDGLAVELAADSVYGAAEETGVQTYTSVESGVEFTTYDDSALVAAWQAQDPSGLSQEEQEVYQVCKEFFDTYITDDLSDLEKETLAHDFIVVRGDYAYETIGEDWTQYMELTTPYSLLVEGTGICLAYASSFQLLMDLLEIPCVTVIGTAREIEDHGWNQVQIDGTWYWVDVTWDDPLSQSASGTLVPGQSVQYYPYFNCTSETMRESSHQWDESAYPEVEESLPPQGEE